MRKTWVSLCAVLVVETGAAQSLEVAGFERELRNQKGAMLVIVDGVKAEWAKDIEALRKDADFIDLDLDLSIRGKADLITYFQERHGLGPRPFWAVFANGKLAGSGKEKPMMPVLKDLKQKAVWRSREDILRDFLRPNPDHREAHLALLGVLFRKAMWRTQLALDLRMDPLTASDTGWDAAKYAKDAEEKAERKRKEEEEAKPVKLLEPEEDERIWGPFAAEYLKAFQAGAWRDWEWSSYQAEYMRHSPRMKEVFRKCYPEVEESLRQWPSRWSYWQVWLQASEVMGGLPLRALLDNLTPGPLTTPENWPPYSVRKEYVKDCRRRKDWPAIKDVLLPQWESERLWKSRDTTRYAMVQDGKEIPNPFDASGWRDNREPLVEALLRMGETVQADEIVRILVTESLGGDVASKASALAQKCGHPALAANWAGLVPGKAR